MPFFTTCALWILTCPQHWNPIEDMLQRVLTHLAPISFHLVPEHHHFDYTGINCSNGHGRGFNCSCSLRCSHLVYTSIHQHWLGVSCTEQRDSHSFTWWILRGWLGSVNHQNCQWSCRQRPTCMKVWFCHCMGGNDDPRATGIEVGHVNLWQRLSLLIHKNSCFIRTDAGSMLVGDLAAWFSPFCLCFLWPTSCGFRLAMTCCSSDGNTN